MPTTKDSSSRQEEKDKTTLSIMCVCVETLLARGVKPSAAVLIASDIVKNLATALGGSVLYLSKRSANEQADRAASIYAEFDGKNHAELAHKFGVSSRHIYEVVARIKKEKNQAVKPDAKKLAELLRGRKQ